MLISSDKACVIRFSQNFLAITFSPSNAVTKPTLIITPVTYHHGRQAVLADGAGGEASSILGFCSQRKGRESTWGTSQTDSFSRRGRKFCQGNSNHLLEMLTLHSDSFQQEWNWMAKGIRDQRKAALPPSSISRRAMHDSLLEQGTTTELPRCCQLVAHASEMVPCCPTFGNPWLKQEQKF